MPEAHRAERRLLVFARAPVPGEAKTRLIAALGAGGAAALHARLVRRTLSAAVAAAPVTLCCAPGPDHPFFQSLAVELGVTLQGQEGEDLGDRMSRAFRLALIGARAVVLIGTDCADPGPSDLADAFAALEGDADAVLGPVEDGGYWLLGLKRWDAGLFGGIAWGTPSVLGQTRGVLRTLGWRWQELTVRHDVDRPEDLRYLRGLL